MKKNKKLDKRQLIEKIETADLSELEIDEMMNYVDNVQKSKGSDEAIGAIGSRKKAVVLENVSEGLERLDELGKTAPGLLAVDDDSLKTAKTKGNIFQSKKIKRGLLECPTDYVGVQNIDYKNKKVQSACVSPDALEQLKDFEKKKKEKGG
ncbi:MAG: hypothetical protein GF364_01610 [Candidatus Lokiarchaeota archaeon]|nr:hypothetical protein [Candidatus Lokiarchaeota archaeon]